MSPPPTAEDRFRALYFELRPQLLRFARRRCDAAAVDDVVADAFLVMWRRFAETPADGDQARAWAYGITRHVMLNHQRAHRRRRALGVRLADDSARDDQTRADDTAAALDRVDLARAWQRLSATHQEAMGLVVFEGLDAPNAAAVLQISPVAFRLRLSRARRALRLSLDHQPPLPHRSFGPVLEGNTP